MHEIDNSRLTQSILPGETEELFKIWTNEILLSGDEPLRSTTQNSEEARSFFRSLSHANTTTPSLTTTTSSTDTALAQLVQAMGDCVTAHKYAAVLHCLVGALQGCRRVSNAVVTLLSTFFLEYIGPLSISIGDADDDEETIRDRALEATKLVLRLNDSPSEVHLAMAKAAVERRFAMVEEYGIDYSNRGLSLLPRSRRSLCFETLQSAVDSVEQINDDEFVVFCIRCLYGESDPRCLLQLLDLLSSVRTKARSNTNDESLLEAVSPYYPIQFSPPPNDVHGITRERLRSSVNRILFQLSCLHIFLELLEPDTSYSEQLEAMEDLGEYIGQNVLNFKVSEMEELSDCLQRVHANASSTNTVDSRRVAERVRVVAGVTAATVEQDQDLWIAFVRTPILRFDITNVMNAAYLASLAARGGELTLRMCLDTALPTVTDFNTIAALCSACRAAMERIPMHPHPLQEHGPKVLSNICDALENEITLPALRAFEAATMVVPSTDLSKAWFERIRKLLSSFGVAMGNHMDDRIREGCSTTMGSILTKALEGGSESSKVVLDADLVRTLLRDEIFPKLIDSVQNASEEGKYARKTLSCVSGITAKSRIVQLLMFSLRSAIRNQDGYRRKGIVDTLADLLQDPAAAMAFQTLEPPNLTVFDLLLSLLPERHRNTTSSNLNVSSLNLPESAAETEIIRQEIASTEDIVGSFRKAYENVLDEQHALQLVVAVDLVLPPLSSSDAIKLSMLFPLLSGLMECDASSSFDSLSLSFRSLTNAFFQLCTVTEIPDYVREHSARCLHASIAKFTPRNAQECPAKDLIGRHIMPGLAELFHEIKTSNVKYQQNKKTKFLEQFQEGVKMMALLGSAAAIRGGPSSKTADSVAFFLLDLAAQRPTQILFTNDISEPLDVAVFGVYGTQLVYETAVIAAHQFGTLLVAGRDARPSIWKQRLLHLASKRLVNFGSYNAKGCLIAVCYLICSGDIQRYFEATSLETFAKAIVDGLPHEESSLWECKRLQLSALMKLVSQCPSLFILDPPHLYGLVTGLLRVYASSEDVVSRLLALRVLDQIGTSWGKQQSSTTTVVHPAVIAVLQTALDHPSRALRSAAAQVRNTWCVANVSAS